MLNAKHLLCYVPFVKLCLLFPENIVFGVDPLHYLCTSSIGRQKHRHGPSSQVNIFQETEEGTLPSSVSSLSVLFVNLPFWLLKWPPVRAVACVPWKTNAFMRKVTLQALKTFFCRILSFFFFLYFFLFLTSSTHCRCTGLLWHRHTHAVGFLWVRDRPVTETSTWKHTRQRSVPPAGFEPAIPASERRQTARPPGSAHRILKSSVVIQNTVPRTDHSRHNRGHGKDLHIYQFSCRISVVNQ